MSGLVLAVLVAISHACLFVDARCSMVGEVAACDGLCEDHFDLFRFRPRVIRILGDVVRFNCALPLSVKRILLTREALCLGEVNPLLVNPNLCLVSSGTAGEAGNMPSSPELLNAPMSPHEVNRIQAVLNRVPSVLPQTPVHLSGPLQVVNVQVSAGPSSTQLVNVQVVQSPTSKPTEPVSSQLPAANDDNIARQKHNQPMRSTKSPLLGGLDIEADGLDFGFQPGSTPPYGLISSPTVMSGLDNANEPRATSTIPSTTEYVMKWPDSPVKETSGPSARPANYTSSGNWYVWVGSFAAIGLGAMTGAFVWTVRRRRQARLGQSHANVTSSDDRAQLPFPTVDIVALENQSIEPGILTSFLPLPPPELLGTATVRCPSVRRGRLQNESGQRPIPLLPIMQNQVLQSRELMVPENEETSL